MRRRCLRPLLLGLCLAAGPAAVLAQAQCGARTQLADPLPGRIWPSNVVFQLRTVLAGLVSPIGGAVAPGQPNRIYVVDQIGKVWALEVSGPRQGESSVFLDLSSRLVPLGLFKPQNYDERGLLGLAFHPQFAVNGLFYTFTSEPASGRVPDFSTTTVPRVPLDPANEVEEQSVVTEWRVLQPGNLASVVDVNSARVLDADCQTALQPQRRCVGVRAGRAALHRAGRWRPRP